MIYKVLIIKNKFTGTLNLLKGLGWFSENTPLEIQVEETSTDFEVTAKDVSNNTYKGVVCGDDIYPKIKSVVPEGKYHCVVFVVGNEMNGIRVFGYAGGASLYYGTDIIQLFKVSDKGMVLNHEIFHTLFNRLRRQQIGVEDPMDSVLHEGVIKAYFNDGSLSSVPSNRSIALSILAPYWNTIGKIPTLTPSPVPSAYKWFSVAEVTKWKLTPAFWKMLDVMRENAGTPFIITSGFRTYQQNIDVGGKPNSGHLKGLAVDLLCTDNFKRTQIVRGILQSGFPVFLELAVKHIHIDISSEIHQLGQTILSNDD